MNSDETWRCNDCGRTIASPSTPTEHDFVCPARHVMTVGFTGTQRGCTPAQLRALRATLQELRRKGASVFHHGDCIGADAEAHGLAVELGYRIVIHPPDDNTKRAFCATPGADVQPPLPYLDRNSNIARECSVLLACPKEGNAQIRSGTWSTVRRARALGRRVLLHLPSGTRSAL